MPTLEVGYADQPIKANLDMCNIFEVFISIKELSWENCLNIVQITKEIQLMANITSVGNRKTFSYMGVLHTYLQ